MSILKIYNNFKNKRIVICPKCQGKKEILKFNKVLGLNELVDCPMCGRSGVMLRIVTIKFKRI